MEDISEALDPALEMQMVHKVDINAYVPSAERRKLTPKNVRDWLSFLKGWIRHKPWRVSGNGCTGCW